MKSRLIICVISVVFLQYGSAQKIDNLVSFRDIESRNYFRFNYDNDFFASSDKNYTQGYSFELVAPFFENNPVNYLFYKPKEDTIRYGLAVEHIGYTPQQFQLPDIQFRDRPFAAAIMLKSFMIASNLVKKSRFTSSFSLGLIGPGAFGKEMQVGIHKATGNKIPLGWQNQIKNDIVINYEVGYEKQLVRYRDLFSLQATMAAKVGTLFTSGAIGVNTTFGVIHTPFAPTKEKKGFRVYGYAQPVLNVIGYDATLQGGLFNRKSPYTISSGNIERFTGQLNYGIVLKTKTLYFEYTRSVITKEFEEADAYKWGGIKIGATF
ncbi:lipid A deacylase LpxR family protein [Cellulophaga sp. E16_2]|uniref:lipid A deacylase LpxR family protein n=1 Tax=Cellulophaga sp. E16_2 TaxID=2789297 RepID=UPI001A931AD0|nr:lipid A deacylase LpxR family protein [Cellulophaga sp. E16_2]MBO0589874.1 lipid A deacylase LpxR family protein [Cellulophaga sp. E16_2]